MILRSRLFVCGGLFMTSLRDICGLCLCERGKRTSDIR